MNYINMSNEEAIEMIDTILEVASNRDRNDVEIDAFMERALEIAKQALANLTISYSTSMNIEALEQEPCPNCIEFKRYAKQMGFEIEQEPCEDTISRTEAINALRKSLYDYEDNTEKQFLDSDDLNVSDWFVHRIFVQNMNDADVKAINDLPSVNPQGRTGHWIPIEYPTGVEAFGVKEMSAQELKCSECGKTVDISDGDFKYCPYCKAKMESED